ncbi:MAG: hypothetical protein Q9217_002672 [Psora testacea]
MASEKRSTTFNADVLTGSSKCDTPKDLKLRSDWDKELHKHDFIEILDLTAVPAKGPFSPLHNFLPGLQGVESYVDSSSIGFYDTIDLNHGLPFPKVLPSTMKQKQESGRTDWTNEHRAEDFQDTIKDGYKKNAFFTSALSTSTFTSPPSIPTSSSTSASSISKTSASAFIPDTPSPQHPYALLSVSHDRKLDELEFGTHKDIELALAADKGKEDAEGGFYAEEVDLNFRQTFESDHGQNNDSDTMPIETRCLPLETPPSGYATTGNRTLEEFALHIGQAQESQLAGSTDERITGRAEMNVEHSARGDIIKVACPRASGGEGNETPTTWEDHLSGVDDNQYTEQEEGHTQDIRRDGCGTQNAAQEGSTRSNADTSDSLTSKKQAIQLGVEQRSPSTPLKSVADSKVAHPTADERNIYSTSSLSTSEPFTLNALSEEKDDNDTNQNNLPSPRSTKKRCRSTAERKPRVEWRIKRRRFSSPLSSHKETETEDDLAGISSFTRSDPYRISKPQATSPPSTRPEKGDRSKMRFTGERSNRRSLSRMAVIYEQQSWAGEIIDERDAKQGLGRPRKQYLVEWKRSWVDGASLKAPGLVQDWRKRKASKTIR